MTIALPERGNHAAWHEKSLKFSSEFKALSM
jgi:hypothetical protein